MTKLKMTKLIFVTLAVMLVALTAVSSAQTKFPLRSGEWDATSSDMSPVTGKPLTMLFCMNDETWAKALNGNPTCSFQQFNLTSSGATYSLSCPGKSFQMTGSFKVVFDGMTHMTSTGSMDITMNGKPMHKDSTVYFHWKGPTCDPNADLNLKNHSVPPPH